MWTSGDKQASLFGGLMRESRSSVVSPERFYANIKVGAWVKHGGSVVEVSIRFGSSRGEMFGTHCEDDL